MRALHDLCADAPTRQCAAGEILLNQGEWTGRLYVLVDGTVEVLRGETVVATLSGPGAVFGEMAVLMDRPHTATVKTASKVIVRVIDHASEFLQANPEMAFLLAKLLAQRLHAATTYLVDLRRQFEGRSDHFGMVGEVLDALTAQQGDSFEFAPNSNDRADPRL